MDKELSAMEMSIICSNLARGCEKQYMPRQAEDFRTLADFFRSKAEPAKEAGTDRLLALIEHDLTVGYPYGNAVAGEKPDEKSPSSRAARTVSGRGLPKSSGPRARWWRSSASTAA